MRILVIGDLHEPVARQGYLEFCKELYRRWKCDTVVFIGDLVDWHAISFHVKEPNCPGPIDEYRLAKARIQRWYTAFPQARVCIGNHDERPGRLAKTVAIPEQFLKSYRSLWGTPAWKWDYSFVLDGVYYRHGTGQGGIHPAWNTAGKLLMSVVMGHCHSRAGIKWRVNPLRRIFSMDVGCGIDVRAFQFVYGKECAERPVLGAGIVLDGIPYHEIMPIGKGEKYERK